MFLADKFASCIAKSLTDGLSTPSACLIVRSPRPISSLEWAIEALTLPTAGAEFSISTIGSSCCKTISSRDDVSSFSGGVDVLDFLWFCRLTDISGIV
jgi:hypothetical protein